VRIGRGHRQGTKLVVLLAMFRAGGHQRTHVLLGGVLLACQGRIVMRSSCETERGLRAEPNSANPWYAAAVGLIVIVPTS